MQISEQSRNPRGIYDTFNRDGFGAELYSEQINGQTPNIAPKSALKGCFRLRCGDWRIVFRPSGDDLFVTAIDNRRDVYE